MQKESKKGFKKPNKKILQHFNMNESREFYKTTKRRTIESRPKINAIKDVDVNIPIGRF